MGKPEVELASFVVRNLGKDSVELYKLMTSPAAKVYGFCSTWGRLGVTVQKKSS